MERLDASTRKSALSSHKRSLTLIPYVSEVERQELDEIKVLVLSFNYNVNLEKKNCTPLLYTKVVVP